MFSFYQIHPTSINKTDGNSSSKDGVTAGTNASTNTTSSHWTSSFLSGVKLLWRGCPNRPTHGTISAFLIIIVAIGIFTILTGKHAITFWPQIEGPFQLLQRETFLALAREMSIAVFPREIPQLALHTLLRGELQCAYHALPS
jgi:hypothetical protein